MIREALSRGADPREVVDSGSHWVIINGVHDQDGFLRQAEENRLPGSSSQNIRRFFTDDDELMIFEGNTYALTKMWGPTAIPTVDKAIQELNLSNVSYRKVETPTDPR